MSKCKICESNNLILYKNNNITGNIEKMFTITDFNYGVTGKLFKCNECNFIQCIDIKNPQIYYETVEDISYENSRYARSFQAKHLLEIISQFKRSGKLLDIGSASGILIEQAISQGFSTLGIEPSQWFVSQAEAKGLPVIAGTFPNTCITEQFDVITLIDVIEHVADPIYLLAAIANQLKDDGVCLIVTPDIDTLLPKIIGHRWWHFRVAHINYFTKKNLVLALHKVGLVAIKMGRPKWVFALDYLYKRIMLYLPFNIKLCKSLEKKFADVNIPINMHDSIYVIAKKM